MRAVTHTTGARAGTRGTHTGLHTTLHTYVHTFRALRSKAGVRAGWVLDQHLLPPFGLEESFKDGSLCCTDRGHLAHV